MAANDPMTIDERRKYLYGRQKRYPEATPGERAKLLDEMEAVTGVRRKSLTRLILGNLERKPRRKEGGRSYSREVEHALQVIAESLDYLCAERLQPILVWMAHPPGPAWRTAGLPREPWSSRERSACPACGGASSAWPGTRPACPPPPPVPG
ncbi:MAG: hypothetical protein NTY23_10225 [Chloroflexi bacterium]|nr:hypothetical protein [Chloroflexota bacterium]